MIEFIEKNYQWFFSGLGVTGILILTKLAYALWKHSQGSKQFLVKLEAMEAKSVELANGAITLSQNTITVENSSNSNIQLSAGDIHNHYNKENILPSEVQNISTLRPMKLKSN